MIERSGSNLWRDRRPCDWVVVTTNGSLNRAGECIMGRGIALEVKVRYPDLPGKIGNHIRIAGNTVYQSIEHGIITFPTKHNFWENSDLKLIENSAKTLGNMFPGIMETSRILIPRPGCGNGKLKWSVVKPVIEQYLTSDHFIIYNY